MNIGRAVRAWRVKKQKKQYTRTGGQDRTGKKSQKGYISPSWGEAPTEAIYIKNYVVGDRVTCRRNLVGKFQNEIFRGYDFTGVEFHHFPIDF